VALNISRVFLAGPGAPAVIVATTLTVLILGGAAWISSAGHLRTSSLALGVSLALLIVLSAGLVTFGAGEEDEEAEGPAAPTGPAVASFEVDALPSLAFQSDSFTTSAGINEITYVNRGGTHTLVFTDPALSYFELVVPPSPDKGKVELTAGEEYVVYCSIAGHREAGMEATLTVTEAAAPAEGGGTTDTTTAGPGAPNGETGTPPERAPAEGGETQTETDATPPGGDAGTGG
jgi:plastocyanin